MTDSVWLKEHGFVETKCRKCGIDVIEPKEHLTHYCGECHQESLDMHNESERHGLIAMTIMFSFLALAFLVAMLISLRLI